MFQSPASATQHLSQFFRGRTGGLLDKLKKAKKCWIAIARDYAKGPFWSIRNRECLFNTLIGKWSIKYDVAVVRIEGKEDSAWENDLH